MATTFSGTGSRADHNRDDIYFRRTQSERMAAAVWANDNGHPAGPWLRDIAAGACLLAFIAAMILLYVGA